MARKSRKNHEVAPSQACRPTFNAGAYIRLSVADRKQKGDSIETQQAIINSFIAECPDIELRDIYIDNGCTGQSFERPAFDRMIADIDGGKINCCLVKDLSRLGRNAIDAGYYIEKFFPSKGIRFIAVTDDYDSANSDAQHSCDGILISLKNVVNETYAIETGRKIRAIHQMNIRNGRYVGNLPPYGYVKSTTDCHKLVPDEYSASIVRRIFEMTASGQSVQSVLNWLTDNEVLPPKRYFHSIGLITENNVSPHTHWSYRMVAALLRNRMYCGDMVQGKTQTSSYVTKKLPKSEWTVVENTHTPVVSRKLFEEVQIIRDKWSTRSFGPEFKTPTTENIFSRKIFCGLCGFTMVRRRHSEWAYSYVCSTKRLYATGACTGSRISENTLKKMVFDMLTKLEPKSSTLPTNPLSSEDNDELTSIRTELEKNKFYFKSLYESLIEGDVTDTEYAEMKASYEAKIAAIVEREKNLREYNRKLNKLSELLTNVQAVKQVSDLTPELIGKLVEKMNIYDDKRIEVKFTFMDEVIIGNGGVDNE